LRGINCKSENALRTMYKQRNNKYERYYGPGRWRHLVKIQDGRSVGNEVTNVYAKFRKCPLRINKALGIFRKR